MFLTYSHLYFSVCIFQSVFFNLYLLYSSIKIQNSHLPKVYNVVAYRLAADNLDLESSANHDQLGSTRQTTSNNGFAVSK